MARGMRDAVRAPPDSVFVLMMTVGVALMAAGPGRVVVRVRVVLGQVRPPFDAHEGPTDYRRGSEWVTQCQGQGQVGGR